MTTKTNVTTEAAATAETDAAPALDIPIVIRGRVIEPGDDALEFGGRAGARFRQADPRKYAGDLVLRDPGDLRDLQATPIDEIIDFLAELGPRLDIDKNPLMQTAFRLALDAGEMTAPVLRPVYEQFPAMFHRDRLSGQVDRMVGKAYLDGWVEQGRPGTSTIRIRAVGTRHLHIIAGNVPVTAGLTVIRAALTKADCLIKTPSNDPFTAPAILRTMVELDPDHPVTKHFAVAYWKGGDEEIERQVIRPSRIEKLTAWGGMASMTHIQKYLVPGIELIAMNPKLSISIVGHEALEDTAAMRQAALGVALMAGRMNQTACSSTRVVYVECDDGEEDLERLEAFGTAVHQAFLALPPHESTAPKRPDPDLEDEMRALALDDEFYRVIGDTASAGVVVSRTADEPVEFADRLANRVVNLVPVPDISRVPRWVSEETQTVGIYPEALRERLRDDLALHGVQRTLPLGTSFHQQSQADREQTFGMPHDGTEPMRRMVRWVIDQSAEAV
ncbi:acyl-CoA reductase [Streptomyces sp. NPDC002896]|uniref:acyl-CoA reductase n=1 Tax=Streptomyces sp. NPDC002896 TaxID=3154438 RepID=UPI00331B9435